jgi:predicted enzyme related to lactoylglutathione lyase
MCHAAATPAGPIGDAEGGLEVPRFEQVTPILCVRDVRASLAYYMDKLGFTDCWSWDDPPTFGGARRDGFEIQFCKDGQGSPGTWMSVWVDDVDALHAELSERGADIRQPPTNFEWGVREMNVADPDGHRLRFGMGTDQPADGVPLAVE